MTYKHIAVPDDGAKIQINADNSISVPNRPIIPFIECDGIGVDITPVMRSVVDAVVTAAYGGARSIAWMEIFAGEKANAVYGTDTWLPDETLAAVREYLVAIKNEYPQKDDASVLLEPDIEYDYLIQVMDTMRSVELPDGGQTTRADLFTAISIGDAP